MRITRQEFVETLLGNPLAKPLNYLPDADSPSFDKTGEWMRFSVNAIATATTRLIVPGQAARFAVADAVHRGKNPLGRARAALVGFAAGTVISGAGIVCNTVQALGAVAMTGVAAGVRTFEHGLESIDALRTDGDAS